MLIHSNPYKTWAIKISKLIDQLGGSFNVYNYICHSKDIFVIVRDIAWIENTNLIFDAYEIRWINKNVVHIMVTEDCDDLNEIFEKCLKQE